MSKLDLIAVKMLKKFDPPLAVSIADSFHACKISSQGRSQDFISTEAKKSERRRRENRGAAGAEGVGSGVGACTLPSRLGGLGERRELPQRGPGRSPGRQRF